MNDKKRDPLLDDPAVMAYREIARRNAPAVARPEIAETVKDLERWQEVVKWWMMAGYNPSNIGGMLEVYRTGDHQRARRGGPTTQTVEVYKAEPMPEKTEAEKRELARRLALRRRAVLEVEA